MSSSCLPYKKHVIFVYVFLIRKKTRVPGFVISLCYKKTRVSLLYEYMCSSLRRHVFLSSYLLYTEICVFVFFTRRHVFHAPCYICPEKIAKKQLKSVVGYDHDGNDYVFGNCLQRFGYKPLEGELCLICSMLDAWF